MQNEDQSKRSRQLALADLIRSGPVASQEELVTRLGILGFPVTQATVSRDLERLGAIRLKVDGSVRYALPEDAAPHPLRQTLGEVLRDWVLSISAAGSLVVLKTPPGSANVVGRAIDQSRLDAIVGTVCGDDTIFIATNDAKAAEVTARDLKRIQEGKAG